MISKFQIFINEAKSGPKPRKITKQDFDLIDVIPPVGQGGSLKGEEEMIRKGLEYVKLLREKFEESDEIFFKNLKLVKLAKELGLNYNFARFINKHEMNVENRVHSLKNPDLIPDLEYVGNIYKEYRKYDTNVQKNRQKRFSPEEREEFLATRRSPERYSKRNKRRRDVDLLRKIKKELEIFTNFKKELTKAIPSLERACKALTFYDFDKANNLFQETIKTAMEYQDRYSIGTNMSAWLIQIASNLNAQYYKRQKMKDKHVIPILSITDYRSDAKNNFRLDIPSDEPEPYDQVEDNSDVILQCFDELPEDKKSILKLKMSGKSHEEIAKILGFKSADYSKTKLDLVRHYLAKKIKEKVDIQIKSTSGKYY